MEKRIETVIIGGGQAGLATSYYLTKKGREHIVLDKADRPAHVWGEKRWDSFYLNTPNWSIRMPGAEYTGDDLDGFLPRAKVVRYFDDYAERFKLPLCYHTTVSAVEQTGNGYRVATDGDDYYARNVVVATGLFQSPRIPAVSARVPSDILQLDTTTYRNAGVLPPGAVLVVGSGQSGCQIAEDLHDHGRQVYVSVGGAPRAPRRYRGKDIMYWGDRSGAWNRPPEQLPSPRMKFAPNPQVSGTRGGHNINLHQFARDGMTLLGHLRDVQDGKLALASDLYESLTKGDKAEAELLKQIDDFIARAGIEAPEEEIPNLRDGYAVPIRTELDLKSESISTIIWTPGFKFDYGLVRLPVVDGDGFPITKRGASDFSGLYFVGMPFISNFTSGLLLGVGRDAEYISSLIAG